MPGGQAAYAPHSRGANAGGSCACPVPYQPGVSCRLQAGGACCSEVKGFKSLATETQINALEPPAATQGWVQGTVAYIGQKEGMLPLLCQGCARSPTSSQKSLLRLTYTSAACVTAQGWVQGTVAYIGQTEGMLPLLCQGCARSPTGSHGTQDLRGGKPSDAVRAAQNVACMDALRAYLLIW